MLSSVRSRAAFSLTEVIVTLFIMALGIISLLTLFPLGAVQMGRALRDDRAQTTCVIADGMMRLRWQMEIADGGALTQDYFTRLDDPDGAGLAPPIPVTDPRPSYPLLFDPIGTWSYTGAKTNFIQGITTNPFARASTNSTLAVPLRIANLFDAIKWHMMPDDLTFSPAGLPSDSDGIAPPATALVRQGRFSWAAAIQRPRNADRTTVNVKILVFDRRSPGVNADNETSFAYANLPVGATQLTVPGTAEALGIRNGSWILDGTVDTVNGIRNMNFYRVTSYEDVAGPNVVLDLETPVLKPTGESSLPTYNATFYIFQELIEVFDRPQLTASGYNSNYTKP